MLFKNKSQTHYNYKQKMILSKKKDAKKLLFNSLFYIRYFIFITRYKYQ